MRRTGVVITVPEVEPSVAQWRHLLDPRAALGVPAHVTVLFPFVPAESVDSAVIERLSRVALSVPAFDFALTRVAWFGDSVVWLAPEPASPFLALTRACAAAFPHYPPYGGVHDEVIPHLTIGDAGTPSDRAAAADALTSLLPLQASANELSLLAERDDGRWEFLERCALGPAPST